MSRARLAAAALALLGGCTQITPPAPTGPAGFEVKIVQFFQGTGAARKPLDVVNTCVKRYGSQAQVPALERGTQACPYVVIPGDLELQIQARALTKQGTLAADFNNAVALRVVPGDVQGGYENRAGVARGGLIDTTVRARHLYGQVRVWVQDGPPAMIYSDGGVITAGLPDASFGSSYATGLSDIAWFDEPTLAKLQQPDGFDNRSSPFVGEFVTIGRRPEVGAPLLQSCAGDPARDGQPLLMVVTGTDPSGFFVSDLSACRQVEATKDENGTTQVRQSEPKEACLKADGTPANGAAGTCAISKAACTQDSGCSSYLPGTYGSIFVYNYSFPDGLDTGDLLFTLGGAVQEFTSTSQLTFPSWTIAERVRQLPPAEWNKWLQFAVPQPISNRLCGMDTNPFLTDSLCGHNRRNLKMESLESSLVKVRNVKFPDTFADCDRNGDFQVPFFCEQIIDTVWQWGFCGGFDGTIEAPLDTEERTCNQDCVIGVNAYAGKVCAERSTFVGFGQFPVELNRSGPAKYGLDESIPARVQSVSLELKPAPASDAGMLDPDGGALDAGPAFLPIRLAGYGDGTAATLVCDADTRVAFGDGAVLATASDRLLRAGEIFPHTFTAAGPVVGLLPEGRPAATEKCYLAVHQRARINMVVKDAVPELRPDCSEADPDAEKAAQCVALRAATYDIVGHLKQVQPGRPRWLILPRDADDVCCRPGRGLSCPKPIKPCP